MKIDEQELAEMVCVVSVEENTRGNIFFALLLYYKQFMFLMPGRDPESFMTWFVILW